VLIAGPCVIESEAHALKLAQRLVKIAAAAGVAFIFKASYDKANRSSLDSYRGPGLAEGLGVLRKIKKRFGVPILTDIHEPAQAAAAAEVCDVLQVPAFLSRQTDLLIAAGKTGRVVNLKKGQFLAPWEMANAVEKVRSTGNRNVILTERGASFGYNNLVVDMRSFPILARTGCPVIFDVTHAVQLPGGQGNASGGQPEFIEPLARAGARRASTGYSWKCTTSRRGRFPTDRMRCHSSGCRSCWRSSRNWPSWCAGGARREHRNGAARFANRDCGDRGAAGAAGCDL